MRFANLVYGWALDQFNNPMAEQTKVREAREQWEFMMDEPLPYQITGWDLGTWHTRAKTTSVQSDRDLFLALDSIETY